MPSYGRPSVRIIFSSGSSSAWAAWPGHLGEAVVAERRDAERLLHLQRGAPASAPGAASTRIEDRSRSVCARGVDMSAACVGIAARSVQRCCSISLSARVGLPAVDEHAGGAVEQDRQVAEDEPPTKPNSHDDEVDVLAGELPALAQPSVA